MRLEQGEKELADKGDPYGTKVGRAPRSYWNQLRGMLKDEVEMARA
jgi:hypothetical protein